MAHASSRPEGRRVVVVGQYGHACDYKTPSCQDSALNSDFLLLTGTIFSAD